MTDSWKMREREAEAVRSCTSDWEAQAASLSRPLSLSWTDSLHTALLSSLSWLLRQFSAQVWDKLGCWHCCRISLHCQLVSWTREIQGRSFNSKEIRLDISFRDVRISLTTLSNIYLSYQNEKIKGNWRLSHSCTSFKPIFLMSRTKGQNVLTNEDAGFLQHWPITVRLVPSLIRWVYDRVM